MTDDAEGDSPGANELVNVGERGLEGGTSDHADSTEPDGGPTADAIGEVGGEGVACEGANVLCVGKRVKYMRAERTGLNGDVPGSR